MARKLIGYGQLKHKIQDGKRKICDEVGMLRSTQRNLVERDGIENIGGDQGREYGKGLCALASQEDKNNRRCAAKPATQNPNIARLKCISYASSHRPMVGAASNYLMLTEGYSEESYGSPGIGRNAFGSARARRVSKEQPGYPQVKGVEERPSRQPPTIFIGFVEKPYILCPHVIRITVNHNVSQLGFRHVSRFVASDVWRVAGVPFHYRCIAYLMAVFDSACWKFQRRHAYRPGPH